MNQALYAHMNNKRKMKKKKKKERSTLPSFSLTPEVPKQSSPSEGFPYFASPQSSPPSHSVVLGISVTPWVIL
jgi:hypothetical protein